MKYFMVTIIFLITVLIALTWLASGNISQSDLFNPTSSAAAAQRAEAETDIYRQENQLRLQHLAAELRAEQEFQHALRQQELAEAEHRSQLTDWLILLGFAVLAAAVLLPALAYAFYWYRQSGLSQTHSVTNNPTAVSSLMPLPQDGRRIVPGNSSATIEEVSSNGRDHP